MLDSERQILVVEDDADIRQAIGEILADHDYVPVLTANGQEALEHLEKSKAPCLILLDIMMPVMDGWQFREAQRRDASIADIPVVILSAHANIDETASQLGAADFIRKPFELDDLLAAIRRSCRPN